MSGRGTETERDRKRGRETERETERQREREGHEENFNTLSRFSAVFIALEVTFTWTSGCRFLAGNRLNETLSAGTFVGLELLTYLDVSRNSLSSLPVDVFSSLWRLSTLNLRDNELRELRNGSFSGLYNLNTL